MTATAASPAPPARQKPARTMHYNAAVGALYLTVGGKEFGYWLDRLPCDRAALRSYRLTRFRGAVKDGEAPHYDVTVHPEAETGECQCKGHQRWAATGTVCKHVAALIRLIETGRLS